MGIYVRFVYVSVEYNRGVEEMVGTSYYVTEEAGARLVAAGCMGDEELDWDNIPEELFETPVWVDGSLSTLGVERKDFM